MKLNSDSENFSDSERNSKWNSDSENFSDSERNSKWNSDSEKFSESEKKFQKVPHHQTFLHLWNFVQGMTSAIWRFLFQFFTAISGRI